MAYLATIAAWLSIIWLVMSCAPPKWGRHPMTMPAHSENGFAVDSSTSPQFEPQTEELKRQFIPTLEERMSELQTSPQPVILKPQQP